MKPSLILLQKIVAVVVIAYLLCLVLNTLTVLRFGGAWPS
jgi:hypothetical protein